MDLALTVNGEERRVKREDAASVEALLLALAVTQRRGVAVAINDAVVPKSRWSEHEVEEGDRVEIIQATQGG